MGEANGLPVDCDHAREYGTVEVCRVELVDRGAQQRERWVGERRDREQRRASGGCEMRQPLADRVGKMSYPGLFPRGGMRASSCRWPGLRVEQP